MNSNQLYINYLLTLKKAKELERAAAKLRRAAENNIEHEINIVKKNWKSEASDNFIKKLLLLKHKMLTEAVKLEKTAEVIRRIAKRTFDTEMEALEISRNRIY